MNITTLIAKELRQRPTALVTSLLAIVLGVAAFVAIRSVALASQQTVARDLEALGANILLLPREATLHDFYAADLSGQTLPEEYAMKLVFANLSGVEHVSPKLCVPVTAAAISTKSKSEIPLTLTGILPQSEFQAKAAWGAVDMFSNKHAGCKKAAHVLDDKPESLATARVVKTLNERDLLLGADVAERTGWTAGQRVELLGERFTVAALLPPTGTIDDSRAFAHLHTVQRVAKAGEVVNSIEIMACCEDAAGGLVPQLRTLFPDAKVVTIAQVVQTQVNVNRTLQKISVLIFAILIAIGGASMATAMYANVAERRREVGTLVALGATPGFIAKLFLGKAGVLGITGGLLGAVLGTVAAVWLGPQLAEVTVEPLPSLMFIAVGVALLVALAASFFPALRAAKLDPCLCFREV